MHSNHALERENLGLCDANTLTSIVSSSGHISVILNGTHRPEPTLSLYSILYIAVDALEANETSCSRCVHTRQYFTLVSHPQSDLFQFYAE